MARINFPVLGHRSESCCHWFEISATTCRTCVLGSSARICLASSRACFRTVSLSSLLQAWGSKALRLLDADRFEGRFREGIHKADVSDMMRRLTKEELYRFDGTPLFPERRAYTASYSLSPTEADLYQAVTTYVREEMNRADRSGDDKRRSNVGFALQILQRRLASSPAAIHRSLERRRKRLEERLREEKLMRQSGSWPLTRAPDLPGYDPDEMDEAPGVEAEATEEQILDQAAQTVGSGC
jgi:hypothetical protein